MRSLEHSPAEILMRAFVARGDLKLPPATPWPVFITHEPDEPDNCVTIYNTQGRKRARLMHGPSVVLPGIQIRVRALTAAIGYQKINDLYVIIDELIYNYAVYIGTGANRADYLINNINVVGDIIDVGYESPTSKRNIHTLNALMNVYQL